MNDMEKKVAFLLATSRHLDLAEGCSYEAAAADLISNGVVIAKSATTTCVPMTEPPKVALEDIVDIDELTKANNKELQKLMDFLTEDQK